MANHCGSLAGDVPVHAHPCNSSFKLRIDHSKDRESEGGREQRICGTNL